MFSSNYQEKKKKVIIGTFWRTLRSALRLLCITSLLTKQHRKHLILKLTQIQKKPHIFLLGKWKQIIPEKDICEDRMFVSMIHSWKLSHRNRVRWKWNCRSQQSYSLSNLQECHIKFTPFWTAIALSEDRFLLPGLQCNCFPRSSCLSVNPELPLST